jgi:hypothetical protein
MTPITDKKKLLLDAIVTEHQDFANVVELLSMRAGELSVDGIGLNGLSPFWRGVKLQLDGIAEKILEESTECVQKLGGNAKYIITQSVDSNLATKVAQAKSADTLSSTFYHNK